MDDNAATKRVGFFAALRGFGRAFWMLNIMEGWERLAYYGMRVVVPIYIMQADEPGGLHFTALQKGSIYFGWAMVQSLLPMFTGGYADRYGYKPTIFVSITVKIVGYVLMATQRTYFGFLMGALTLAAGTAIFKPGIQGSLAQTMTKKNSSLGWSLFYQLVNVGAWVGAFLASWLRGISWPAVFYGCAAIVSLNYLMLFTYKEIKSGADSTRSFIEVFKVTIADIWPFWFVGGRSAPARFAIGLAVFGTGIWMLFSSAMPGWAGWGCIIVGAILMTWLRGGRFTWQLRLPALIVILAGFWMMMFQLWDLHPNFIVDWVNSTPIAQHLEALPEGVYANLVKDTDRGPQVKQEHLLNLNALLIIFFVSLVGWAVEDVKRLTCMLAGMIMGTLGIMVAGWTSIGYVLLLGIAFFSFGEMLTGPKKLEYFALIAPPGKKAQYLGYVNIPVAIGQGFGALLAGWAYGNFGEKAILALRFIAEKTEYGAAKAWDGSVKSLEETLNITRADAFAKMQELSGLDAIQATDLLWNTYHPHIVWLPFAAVGVVSAIALYIFSRMSRRWADMDV